MSLYDTSHILFYLSCSKSIPAEALKNKLAKAKVWWVRGFMNRKTFAKIIGFWLIPLTFNFGYLISAEATWTHVVRSPLNLMREVLYLSLTSSVIWVSMGFLFTILFGGIVIEFLLKLLAHKKLFNRTLVAPAAEQLKKLSAGERRIEARAKVIFKIFVLVFAVNFIYVLFLIKSGWIPSTSGPFRVFTDDEVIACSLFLPLLTLVLPLSVGEVKVRQVDSSPVHSYWLWQIFSIAGGIGVVLLFLQGGTLVRIIPSTFLFAVCSWYAALGVLLALPTAQKLLARRLLRLRGHEKVTFGKVWVGTSKVKAKEV
jgi:hypothetical protein